MEYFYQKIKKQPASIQQGLLYLQNKQKFNEIERKKSFVGIEPMVTMENMNNYNQLSIQKLNDEFQQTLSEYSRLYQSYLEGVMQKYSESNAKFLNSLVENNGNYYYINKYGFVRGVTKTLVPKLSTMKCPTNTMKITTEQLSQYPIGAIINEGEECGLEMMNIQDGPNGLIAFVDAKGVKHNYEHNDIWNRKNPNCRKPLKVVSKEVFHAIQTGSEMTENNDCSIDNQEGDMWNRIMSMNEELLSMANELYQRVIENNKKGDDLNLNLEQQRENLKTQIGKLELQNNEIKKHGNVIERIRGDVDDIERKNDAIYLRYITWLIVFITGTAISIHQLMRK